MDTLDAVYEIYDVIDDYRFCAPIGKMMTRDIVRGLCERAGINPDPYLEQIEAIAPPPIK